MAERGCRAKTSSEEKFGVWVEGGNFSVSSTLTQKLVFPKSKAVTVEMTASQGEVTGFRKKEPRTNLGEAVVHVIWLASFLWLWLVKSLCAYFLSDYTCPHTYFCHTYEGKNVNFKMSGKWKYYKFSKQHLGKWCTKGIKEIKLNLVFSYLRGVKES